MHRNHIVGEEVVASAAAGDPAALERLLVACHERLLAALRRRIGNRTGMDVEDVAQQTYCAAFKSITSFKPGGGDDGFFRWLLGIAEHRLADMRRQARAKRRGGRAARMSLDAVVDWLVTASHASPSRTARRYEMEQALSKALAQLPSDYAAAIQMRYVRGLNVAQIAAEMGRTERAVHMLCNRGLKRLRNVLGSESGFLTRPA